jgi:hypothetical protein
MPITKIAFHPKASARSKNGALSLRQSIPERREQSYAKVNQALTAIAT